MKLTIKKAPTKDTGTIILKKVVVMSKREKKTLDQPVNVSIKTFDWFDFHVFKNERDIANKPKPALSQQLHIKMKRVLKPLNNPVSKK
jgi:hypothetical protein